MNYFAQWEKLLDARDEESWFSELQRLAGQVGFEYTMFAMVPKPGMSVDGALIRSNYSEAWRAKYEEQSYAHVDPTVGHCLTRSSPLIWTPEIFQDAAQKSMAEEARSHGLVSGLSLPIHRANSQVGMLTLVTDQNASREMQKHIQHFLPELALLKDMAADTSQPFLDSYIHRETPKLTPRELECLKWTAAGKSSWEISRIIVCTEATVNFHIKNVREKFGVNSRSAAVLKAFKLGIISPS